MARRSLGEKLIIASIKGIARAAKEAERERKRQFKAQERYKKQQERDYQRELKAQERYQKQQTRDRKADQKLIFNEYQESSRDALEERCYKRRKMRENICQIKIL